MLSRHGLRVLIKFVKTGLMEVMLKCGEARESRDRSLCIQSMDGTIHEDSNSCRH